MHMCYEFFLCVIKFRKIDTKFEFDYKINFERNKILISSYKNT